jgi:hypothetical protein
MHKTHNYLAITSLGLVTLVTLACHDSTAPAGRRTGSVEITIATMSESVGLDPGGFTFSIDGGPPQPIGSNARQTIAALPVGAHVIRLDGLTPNCSVSDGNPNPRWVVVTEPQPASVSFAVSCITNGGDSGAGYWDY